MYLVNSSTDCTEYFKAKSLLAACIRATHHAASSESTRSVFFKISKLLPPTRKFKDRMTSYSKFMLDGSKK
jgi:hypothetical protein